MLSEDEWNTTRHIVDEFTQENGPGEKLQSALEEWAKDHANWLEPFWDDAYLCGREPLALNTNPFFCPGEDALIRQPPRSQTERAADIIAGMVRMKQQLDSGTFPAETVRDKALCMYQYQRLYSTTRIPYPKRDILRSPDAAVNPTPRTARHIIVICKGHIYSVDVIDQNGKIRQADSIKTDLDNIVGQASSAADESVGMLTALNRDEWASSREDLAAIPKNAANLDCIETALFALCLESGSPDSRNDYFMALLAGEEGNRWYDKSLQFIVFPDGQYGLNMEHSGLDASPIVRIPLFDPALNTDQDTGKPVQSTGHYKRLEFILDNKLRNAIQNAHRTYRNQISNTDLHYNRFKTFGKDFIKSCQTSPDAFVQLAIQLAQYRLFGKCRSTYEAVMTRPFLHGRTEAMRPVTPEALRFVQCMDSPSFSELEKAERFRKAAKAHTDRLTECKTGAGIQRHLYGLECVYKRSGQSLNISGPPSIISSTAWQRLCHDFLSTSTAGSAEGMVLAGFAPVVEDGFGICYLISGSSINFTVSCRNTMKPYLIDFVSAIGMALSNMGLLVKQTA